MGCHCPTFRAALGCGSEVVATAAAAAATAPRSLTAAAAEPPRDRRCGGHGGEPVGQLDHLKDRPDGGADPGVLPRVCRHIACRRRGEVYQAEAEPQAAGGATALGYGHHNVVVSEDLQRPCALTV